jgi:hypothetical protein
MDWCELVLQVLGAGSGIGAAVAAFQSWKTAKELNRIETERDAKQARAAERYQAEHFAVVGVECEEGSDCKRYGLLIVNGADAPVFDVHIESQLANGAGTNLPLDLVIVPPGRFIIFIKSGKWDVLLDQDTVRSKTSVIAKGTGGKMVTCVTFSDSSSKRWTLREGRALVEE